MKNYTLMVLAFLCLSLTSCLKDEAADALDFDVQLESRSANNIHLSYTSADGTITTDCTLVEVNYDNNASASLTITYVDGSTTTVFGNNIQFTTDASTELEVIKDGSASFGSNALDISACGSSLCYNAVGVGTGTGLDFIVEDEPSGM